MTRVWILFRLRVHLAGAAYARWLRVWRDGDELWRMCRAVVCTWAVAFVALLGYWETAEWWEPGRDYPSPWVPCALVAGYPAQCVVQVWAMRAARAWWDDRRAAGGAAARRGRPGKIL